LLNEAELARRSAALRERLDAPPATSWKPTKPELGHPRELVGVFVRTELGADRGYGESTAAVLRTLEGAEWKVWLSQTALRDQFERLGATVGDLVAVRYEGLEPAREGRSEYQRYTVAIDKGSSEPAPLVCEQCGYRDGEHAPGCPSDVPF
jgi:hypothetical protein